VAQRIVRLAKIVGREAVIGAPIAASPRSPFAQRVHPTIMWAKLKSLADGAKIATQNCGAGATPHERRSPPNIRPERQEPEHGGAAEQIRTAPAAMSFAFSTET